MRLAVIPARGGSKRIPRKNIKLFAGRPIIAWSIDAALSSECFGQVLVSTDDLEIADVARSLGAEVPFLRPAALSDDRADTSSVVRHAIKWCTDNGKPPEEVCCIYATAPFVRAEDLRTGLEQMRASGAGYAFSVTTFPFPIQRALGIDPRGRVTMFRPENMGVRSQDLEPAFHDAGQFYWGQSTAWMSKAPIFSSEASPVLLPRHRVQDIDTPEDWVRAEWLFSAMRELG